MRAKLTRRIHAAVVPAMMFACCLTPTARAGYVVRDVGTLGGSYSYGLGVNDAGQVTGFSYTTNDRAVHPFLWSGPGSMADLGTLGGQYAYGEGVNSHGYVTGYSYLGGVLGQKYDATRQAFLKSPGGGMVGLGTLGGGFSSGSAVNDRGQVAGFSLTASGATHAFLWSAGKGMVDLGTLGGAASAGSSLNARGDVTGYSTLAHNGGARAFLRTASAGMVDLGTLGGHFSVGKGINVHDDVVGYSATAGSTTHAFLWSAGRGMTDLGTLGGSYSVAEGVNARGNVVGQSSTAGHSYHGFLWTAKGGMVDLNGLLAANSGWSIRDAEGINSRGQIAALGQNLRTGRQEVLLLAPTGALAAPEPSSMAPAALGAAGLWLAAARKRRRAASV